ncbi:biotin/lipoyl-containing protein [Microbacterium sp. A94]|uniref:biotin/lipoyl-containing protein n=1 Tax=Microbacterium sp. A94 TaxID=3450717 RepID=UPI003F42B490
MFDIIVPKAGLEGDSVEIVSLLVSVGDAVTPGTPMCEVEGAKLSFEITAEVTGTVAEILVAEGDEIDAGGVVLRVQP